MPKINIRCPSCSEVGYLAVEEEIIRNNARGVTAINVGEDLICKHSFIIYVDTNFDVRDAFLTDFTIELPVMRMEDFEIDDNSEKFDIDLYIITINISPLALMFFARCIINNKKIIYITEVTVLSKHFNNFLKFILKDTFKVDLTFLDMQTYKNTKKKYKDHLVFDNLKVFNDKKKFLNPKTMRVERTIIQKFLSELDPQSSMIILKSEFQKSFMLAKDLLEKIKELSSEEQNEQIDAKFFYGFLEKKYNTKISLPYLKFLVEIVENYFQTSLPIMWKFFILRL